MAKGMTERARTRSLTACSGPLTWPRRGVARIRGFVLVGAVVVSAVSVVSAAAAPESSRQQAQSGTVRQAQVLEHDRTGVDAPAGLAYSSTSRSFYVIGARSGAGPAETDVVRLAPYEFSPVSDRAGEARIAASVKDPANVAFDARHARLLLLDNADRLLEVRADSKGDLDPRTLVRRDALRLDLRDAQGMTVDPASGVVFVLDAAQPRVVRLEPDATGSFDAATVSDVDLSPSGVNGVRGIAFDPSTGHLQVGSAQGLVELTTSGSTVATRDLTDLGLARPSGMAFAPSGDSTDDPAQLSVYVADSGSAQGTGQIVELSLAPTESITAASTSTLLNTVNLANLTPPSPDASGITYVAADDKLVISDGEVEETVNGVSHFVDSNVWELTRTGTKIRSANISRVPPTVVPMTDEPAGVAFNPTNGHYYVTADGAKRVFDLNPGSDGLIGTAGDTWTHFSTEAAGNGDPEGITYNTFNGRLYVADGVNREIYEYETNGTLVSHFDVLQHGVNDPEAVEFNPTSGTLFTLSQSSLIVETTTSGALVNTIDVSASGGLKHAGLAYAPRSDGSGAKSFYIVDRGIDNNVDPNAVDGKLFEMEAPTPDPPANLPPVVNAGSDQSVTLPATASLDGTVTDDNKPDPPNAVTTTWTQVSGPGTVAFGNASAVDTTASAPIPGVYVVRLTANDSQFSSHDDVTLTFTGSGSADVLEVRVTVAGDDAEEIADGTVQRGDGDLDMMIDATGTGSPKTIVGMRFNGITVPQGASISNAYIQFQADETDSATTTLTIKGQAHDNAPVFSTTAFDLTSRPKTTASAAWPPAAWTTGESGLAQRTSNIAGVVQEIVGRSGWASGNSLALFVTGTGERVAVANNQNPAVAPLLHVEWNTGGGNVAPVITSNGGGPTAAASPAENQTFVADVDATDPDPGTLTYSLAGGVDQGKFTINGSTGVLTFATAPNFEAPTDAGTNNVYDVVVSVSDGNGGSDSQAIAATVLNVNEFPPIISSNGGGATANVSVPENTTAVTTVAATDGDFDTIAYSLAGGDDMGDFSINPTSGALTFVTPPDYEAPADANLDNTYVVTVTASDGSLSDDQTLSVAVTDVVGETNTPPVVNAGTDQTITLPASATLDGTVSDDGLPNPPAAVTATWSKTSGPGTVTFGNASAVDTTASFSQDGSYVLRLTANDGALSASDELTVTVNPNNSQMLDVQVSVGADDAEEKTDNSVLPGNADLDLMAGDENNLVVGTRFRNVTIPQSATITNAYLQLTADEIHNGATTLSVKGEAADNPAVFQNATANISSRPTTTASASWTVDPWLNVGDALAAQRSPNLAAIVQEIVNRSGWASGNSLVLLLTGSGTRVAESYNGLSTSAPILHVEWNTSGNQAPVVDAGPDQAVTLSAGATLDGTVSDDGLPNPPGSLTTTWSMTSGPGTVTFGDASAVDTTATFSAPGTYVLRLTASDGDLSTSDELTVTVSSGSNSAPTVSAGSDQTITLPSGATLDGTVSDDGLPNPPGALTTTWSQVSGPGTAMFGNANAVDTTVTFSAAGTYTLRLTANDSALSTSDDVIVTVNPPASSSPLYFSLLSLATVGGVTADNEDVVLFNGSGFSLVFDGSDVGAAPFAIDAFSWIGPTTLLLSFTDPGTVGGVAFDDSDVLRFEATSLGPTTAGSFFLYFDGSDVGLTASAEDVDAFELLADGRILISTSGNVSVTGVSGDDKDLLEFTPTSTGDVTVGTYAMYFDGSDVGLTQGAEDVDAAAVDSTGKIYLSTFGAFAVTGVSGADEDVFVFTPTSTGATTAGSYSSTLWFDGSAHGLGANDVVAIDLP